MTLRNIGYSILALLAPCTAPSAGRSGELRIAAWNHGHLDDIDSEGCVGRGGANCAALARRTEELGADVVAFQEVENTSATHRVFPVSDWQIEI